MYTRESGGGLIGVTVVAAVIGFSIGYSAGARLAERLLQGAIHAAAEEIRASSYAPIIAASITGGTAILASILLPLITVLTIHHLSKKESYADIVFKQSRSRDPLVGDWDLDRNRNGQSGTAGQHADCRRSGDTGVLQRLPTHNDEKRRPG